MVTIFGLGFVGLTTALGFAHQGYKVFGVDTNSERAAQIARGELPFLEPHMDVVLQDTIGTNFYVTDNIEAALKGSSHIFYCVGTPYGQDGAADLTYLYNAIDSTIENINDSSYRVLIIKSTVPPSTTLERVLPYLQNKGIEVGVQLGLANNPEFLREGYCWEDFIHADRIVLGCQDERSAQMLTELYGPFGVPLVLTNYNTAEFIKYLSNTLLATMISYSNEMSLIADSIGQIDIRKAFKTLHMDKRWNAAPMTSYVYPGCGYGGYCLPKDTNALLAQSKQKGFEPRILSEVIQLNDNMPALAAQRIMATAISKDVAIGILGLSFKPNSDDVRDTPAAKIIQALIDQGYTNIVAHDPVAIDEFKKHYRFDIRYCSSLEEIYDIADILAITTAWTEYMLVREECRKTVVDCRYCLDGLK